MLEDDPILNEIWEIRAELAKEADYDIHKMFEISKKNFETNKHRYKKIYTKEDLEKDEVEIEKLTGNLV